MAEVLSLQHLTELDIVDIDCVATRPVVEKALTDPESTATNMYALRGMNSKTDAVVVALA